MIDSIWKTDGLREASTKKLILYFAGGSRIPYTGWNHPDIMMLSASNESWWNYTDVMRWCYVDDLIAQADKAELWERFADNAKEHIDGLNNMIDSWCKLILGDLPNKHNILKEAITTYCYERRQKENQ